MNIEQLVKLYTDKERECWRCTDYIKHNPVLYPRVGDIFLKELFTLANPARKIPYNRRKKVRMDSVWYKMDQTFFAYYVIGCEIALMLSEDLDIHLQNGQCVPFSAYWFLICLFLGEAKDPAGIAVSADMITRWKKEKEQKGICKPDCRKYYRAVGLTSEHIASDFPPGNHFCPMQLEYDCKMDCPKQMEVGDKTHYRGMMNFRQKEELLYFCATRKRRLPQGVLAGEMLYQFLSKEYKNFYELLNSEMEAQKEKEKERFNCQLFAMFAYLADALSYLSWIRLFIYYDTMGEKLGAELEGEGLWQLREKQKNEDFEFDNPLVLMLILSDVLNPLSMREDIEICGKIDFCFDGEKKRIHVVIPKEISKMESIMKYRQKLNALNRILEEPIIVVDI